MRPNINRRHDAARRAFLLCAPLLFIFLNPDAAPTAATYGGGAATARDSSQSGGPSSAQFEGTTGVTEKTREGVAPAVLRSVRTARHGAFERVVFEFDGDAPPPGYRVEYAERPVRRCGSGRAVSVAGRSRLLVRLRPAQAHTEAGRPTVTQRERRLRLGALREMKLICDFEADVEVVFGLTSAKRYRVLELTNPTRLVVDIRR
ncbi:MAG TPA: hypothetical protein VER08_02490 [Pyrinomonadaceae bacterium]|nr:hypothetical protein [Pyrinomonadaceae bacterium]